MKFRVLRGNHAEGTYPEGHPWAGRAIVYHINDVVDSASNLSRFNNPGPLGPKFQRIYDPNLPATDKIGLGLQEAKKVEHALAQDDGNGNPSFAPPIDNSQNNFLESMTVEELRKLAEEEEIDLPTKGSKSEIIKLIRAVYA